MGLVQLERRGSRSAEERAAHVQAMLREIDDTIVTVRRISTDLRPSVLDDLGLAPAVEWQCGEFESRSGIACETHAHLGSAQVAPETATTVFRVLQETLTNVIRHAQATRVQVTLRSERGQLLLEVRDNGRGITPAELANRQSLGLLGMRERVESVRGHMDIRGVPGQGTSVRITVPLEAAR
jgi:signal transduction histidine kinase